MSNMDIAAALDGVVQTKDWDAAASRLGLGVEELKGQVEEAYRGLSAKTAARDTAAESVVTAKAASEGNGTWSQDFDFTIWEIIGIKGKLSLSATSIQDWKAQLDISPVIIGIPFKTMSYQIDAQHLGYEWEENFLNLAKLRLGYNFGFDQDASGKTFFTMRLKGTAAYYDLLTGWHSADFDVEVIRLFLW
jgi:hypothetical protein